MRTRVGLSLFGLLVLVALAGPLLARHPNSTDYAHQLLSPSLRHLLGTDADGRDELARTVAGTRTTLSASLLVFTITTAVGLVVGGISGYLGGPADAGISRIMDALLGLPSMIIALAVVGALGAGYWNLVLAISFSGWAYMGRVARSHVLGSGNRLDVIAARLAGIPRWRVFAGHVVPPALAHVGVAAASTVGDTILALAGLSFLGLGAQPPTAELGQMLSDSRGDLASHPWLAIGPAVVLVLAVVAAVLVSDGLRDSSDVRPPLGAGLILRPTASPGEGVLSVRDLIVTYPTGVTALRGVTLTVAAGECVAVVGESGCGKTTLARAMLQLLPPRTEVAGSIVVAGVDVLAASPAELRRVRGVVAGYVGQDPYAACDPLQPVRRHVSEPWRARRLHVSSLEVDTRVAALGVEPPRLRERPHHWSGGMLQRATIAAAHAHRPQVTIADEPTSALDADLADGVMGCVRADSDAVLLISHDLRVVGAHADRIVVVYAGAVVETGAAADVMARPRHPYTQALLHASGTPAGEVVEHGSAFAPRSSHAVGHGCAFAPRCPDAVEHCTLEAPPLSSGVACWLAPPI